MNFATTKNGYKQDQVDAYIKMISDKYTEIYVAYTTQKNQYEQLKTHAQELEILCKQQENEIASLKAEQVTPVEKTEVVVNSEPSPAPSVTPSDATMIGQVLIEAKRLAAQITDQAKFEAEKIKSDTKAEREQFIAIKTESVNYIQKIQGFLDKIGAKDEDIGGTQPGIQDFPWVDFAGKLG
ncbi:MAG: hypothetical protein LBI03_05005 [Clostridiales bacterium]|jgi:cell division septum initiation protein DivIVA|nr:hypothetical protein [Clostridiales bacterium]